MTRLGLASLVAVLLCALPALAKDAPGPAYPDTRMTQDVVELHGETIPDPYRWLEPDKTEEVIAWDNAQMAILRRHLDANPRRKELKARMDREFAGGGMRSLPTFKGAWRWYTYRPQGANQAVLYRTDVDATGEPEVVIDPNTWSEEGTSAMKAWEVSPDGRYVAYRRDAEGSEDTTLFVLDTETGKDLPDRITRTKFSGITWDAYATGFFYNRMPDPDSVPAKQSQYHSRVYYHRLGTLVLDDPMVYGQGRPMLENCWSYRSSDQKHFFFGRGMPYKSVETFEATWKDGKLQMQPLIQKLDERTWIDRVGDTYIIDTDRNTGNREIFTAERTAEGAMGAWKLVDVPRGKRDVVKAAWVVGGKHLLVHVKANVVSRLYVRPLAGGAMREVQLPGPGTVGRDISTRLGDMRIWFSFQSFARASTVYRCDLASEDLTLVAEETLPTTVDLDTLVSTQTTYKSKDGTEIPIFLLHRKDVKLDGSAPTVLYGYGGFRVGMYPYFSRSRALWAELGGVFAVACLRGGDEFGEDWHQAGCLANKQNVYDDFIAGADWLVSSGKASRKKLAIQGGSNGGLLVAVCVNQRPDLCGAAICSVPLTDMLRYHKFQYAKSWTKEYGDPDKAEEFTWIRPYSPYHNAPANTAYPAVMVTAGLKDGRVNAYHARKMAAVWQKATTSGRPILLRIDRKGGHSAAGLSRALETVLDEWCFLLSELGG